MVYKTYSFIAYIDGSKGRSFEFQATGIDGARADLMESFGTTDVVIAVWREV